MKPLTDMTYDELLDLVRQYISQYLPSAINADFKDIAADLETGEISVRIK